MPLSKMEKRHTVWSEDICKKPFMFILKPVFVFILTNWHHCSDEWTITSSCLQYPHRCTDSFFLSYFFGLLMPLLDRSVREWQENQGERGDDMQQRAAGRIRPRAAALMVCALPGEPPRRPRCTDSCSGILRSVFFLLSKFIHSEQQLQWKCLKE